MTVIMSGSRPVHERRTTGTEEDDEIDPMVDQQGCGKVYAKLEVSLPKRCSFMFTWDGHLSVSDVWWWASPKTCPILVRMVVQMQKVAQITHLFAGLEVSSWCPC
jgi:hypothetical protein